MDLDLLGHHEGGIKADSKLTNQVGIGLFLTFGDLLEKSLGTRVGDRTQVFDELISRHPDPGIG